MGRIPNSRRETKKHTEFPVVLVVAGSPALAAQTQEASRRLGAVVKETSVSELATEAARHLPFAVLISEATYDFDPEEFDALARDVRACLIPIPSTGMSTEALEDRILKAALESEERRSRGSSMPPAR